MDQIQQFFTVFIQSFAHFFFIAGFIISQNTFNEITVTAGIFQILFNKIF